jgi:hypothetical protein
MIRSPKGNLVERVVGRVVEQGVAGFRRAHSRDLDLVHVTLEQFRQGEAGAQSIFGDLNFGNGVRADIDRRTAIGLVVFVGETRDTVRCHFGGGIRIYGLGEGNEEAVIFGGHFLDLEGCLAGPGEAFQPFTLGTDTAPAAVGFTGPEGGVLTPGEADDAAFKNLRGRRSWHLARRLSPAPWTCG